MLREIPGERLRRQYYNIPIYLILSIYSAIVAGSIVVAAKEHTLGSVLQNADFLSLLAIGAVVLVPLLVLSILNRYCFGKLVCVLNKKGLYYEDGGHIRCIDWRDIIEVRYDPDVPTDIGRRFCSFNTAHVTAKPFRKEIEHEVIHAPFLLLRKMRKYAPNIRYGFSGTGVFLVLAYALGPTALFVLAVLFA